jgi:hypothetical protein
MNWLRKGKSNEQLLAAATARLIADAEAFLVGDYANKLRLGGVTVPAWAQLNVLAHAGFQRFVEATAPIDVRRLPPSEASWPEQSWGCARRVLASEILRFVGNDPEILSRVQQSVLVPLEFQLMDDEEKSSLTAFELVQVTRAALRATK